MDYLRRYLPLAVFLIILAVQAAGAGVPNKSISSVQPIEIESMIIIQGNSLVGTAPPAVERKEENTLVDEIIFRESRGDPKACNTQYGCRAGMGLAGFIPKTWNSTLDRMACRGIYDTKSCLLSYLPKECDEYIVLPENEDKHEAIFNGRCNTIVAKWLLEKDGIRHWESEDGSWGTGPYDLTIYK